MENLNVSRMFEVAARRKFRYTYKGYITTEDLFDLTVEQLDTIFKGLNAKVKASQEESLLTTRSVEDEDTAIKIEIIRYIVAMKIEQKNKAMLAKQKAEKREKILAAMADAENKEYANMSKEELTKKLAELDEE